MTMKDKDYVFGPLPKKKRAVFHHPLGFELYDGIAMDLHAMTFAEQCVKAEREACANVPDLNLSAPEVQKRLAAQWGYVPAEAQPNKVHAVVCFYGLHYYVSALFVDPTSAIARCRKEINNNACPDSWKVVEFEIEDALDSAQPAPSFADAYQGAMEEVAIWKKRALEAEDLNRKFVAEINGPTYMGEPAKPAPSEQDASVRKAWARFSHELHRSPDAPYPGMADAFEQHFSQSFTDREWRAEAATWAAAWKAAKRHCAQGEEK